MRLRLLHSHPLASDLRGEDSALRAGRLTGRPATVALPAIPRKLQLHRHLNQSESLLIKPSLLFRVLNGFSASKKDASNVAEDYWVLTGIPGTKHWLHPYPNGDALLERFWVTR